MRDMVRKAKRDPKIRLFTAAKLANIPGKAWGAEVTECFYWVTDNIRYTQDINGIETLQEPEQTIDLGYGDCDDMCMLLAAMLESIGHPCRFVALAFVRDGLAPNFSHVICETIMPDRTKWTALDPTEANGPGWYPPGVISRMVEHI